MHEYVASHGSVQAWTQDNINKAAERFDTDRRANPPLTGPYFRDGDLASGTLPSIPGPFWFEMVTQELVNLVRSAEVNSGVGNLSPELTNWNQVRDSIGALVQLELEQALPPASLPVNFAYQLQNNSLVYQQWASVNNAHYYRVNCRWLQPRLTVRFVSGINQPPTFGIDDSLEQFRIYKYEVAEVSKRAQIVDYEWFHNDISVSVGQGTYTPANLDPGDVIYVQAVVADLTIYSDNFADNSQVLRSADYVHSQYNTNDLRGGFIEFRDEFYYGGHTHRHGHAAISYFGNPDPEDGDARIPAGALVEFKISPENYSGAGLASFNRILTSPLEPLTDLKLNANVVDILVNLEVNTVSNGIELTWIFDQDVAGVDLSSRGAGVEVKIMDTGLGTQVKYRQSHYLASANDPTNGIVDGISILRLANGSVYDLSLRLYDRNGKLTEPHVISGVVPNPNSAPLALRQVTYERNEDDLSLYWRIPVATDYSHIEIDYDLGPGQTGGTLITTRNRWQFVNVVNNSTIEICAVNTNNERGPITTITV